MPRFNFAPLITTTLGTLRPRERPKADPAYLRWLDYRIFETIQGIACSEKDGIQRQRSILDVKPTVTATWPTTRDSVPPKEGIYCVCRRKNSFALSSKGWSFARWSEGQWHASSSSWFSAKVARSRSKWLYAPKEDFVFDPTPVREAP